MQAYSMDLRERALLDSDAGMKAADVAVKYRVSGSWVRLLKQRQIALVLLGLVVVLLHAPMQEDRCKPIRWISENGPCSTVMPG